MGFFSPTRCDYCGMFLRKKAYVWNFEGRDLRLCPTCSGRFERKASKEAFDSGVPYVDRPGKPLSFGCGSSLAVIVLFCVLIGIISRGKPTTEPPVRMVPNAPAVASSAPTPMPAPTRAIVIQHAEDPSTPPTLGPPNALDVEASKRRAVEKYPALAKFSDDFAIKYRTRYKIWQLHHDTRLLSPTWPEELAQDCANR